MPRGNGIRYRVKGTWIKTFSVEGEEGRVTRRIFALPRFATVRSLISTSAPPSVCLLSVSDVSSFLEDRFPLELVWSSFKRGKCLLRRDSRCQLAFNPQGFVGRRTMKRLLYAYFPLRYYKLDDSFFVFFFFRTENNNRFGNNNENNSLENI